MEGVAEIVYGPAMTIQSITTASRKSTPGDPIDHFEVLAGWLIDGSGAPAQRKVIAEIAGGRIHAIRPARTSATPQDIEDLSACTILPVLADAHVHLFMSSTADPGVREAQLHASYDTITDVIRGHLQAHLSCGVQVLRDAGDYGGFALRFREERREAPGLQIHLKCAGRAWRASGRYGRLIGRSPEPGETLGRAIARCKDPVDHVKIVNSGINSLSVFGKETPPQFTLAELKEAAEVCRDLGLPMMVHANGREPVELAVETGCDSVEHGFFMGRENLRRMAELGTFWVPTAHTMEAYANSLDPLGTQSSVAREILSHQIEQMAQAREEGVLVALGTDCGSLGVHHGASVRQELRLFMQAGYSIEEAIQCATARTARLMRAEDAFGRLAPGMPASFLVVPGTPKDLPGALGKIERMCVGGAWMRLSDGLGGRHS